MKGYGMCDWCGCPVADPERDDVCETCAQEFDEECRDSEQDRNDWWCEHDYMEPVGAAAPYGERG